MTSDCAETRQPVPEEFLAEAEEIVAGLAADLADLADLVGGEGDNPDLLNAIFRGAHSLKGLAGLFGFSAISELAHQMESLLDRLRLGRLALQKPVMWLLFEAQALLKSLLKDLAEQGQTAHGDEIVACCSRIDSTLSSSAETDPGTLPDRLGLPDELISSLTEYERHRLRENLDKGRKLYSVRASYDQTGFDGELTRLSDTLRRHGEIISTLPGPGDDPDREIGFQLLFATQEGEQRLRDHLSDSAASIACLTPLPRFTGELPAPAAAGAEERGATLPLDRDEALSAKRMSRTVRVDLAKLDDLMHTVAELSLAQTTIAALALRMRRSEFSPLARDLARASRQLERKLALLRRGVTEMRMIPVGQLYERISLIVRTISREQGKQVELRLLGAETELDKLIVEDISDPMMHIIRNAVDHGIEQPGQRRELGKPETGVISVSARQKGSHVVIEVQDDGNGIDLDRVRAVAARGGVVPDAARLSDREALELIFLPGFSTSDRVSDVSGRGVGMDVVRNNINAISGMVDLKTVPGRGTRCTLTLPVTLAMTRALLVSCAGRNYALPIAALHETLLVTGDNLRETGAGESVLLRGVPVPLLRLERFLGLHPGREQREECYVVVAGMAETRRGILVDDLLGQQDIVVKPLGEPFRGLRGICGAADLGELGTILVLDPGAMIAAAAGNGA